MGSNPNNRNMLLGLLLWVVGGGYVQLEMPFDSGHNGGYIRHKLLGIHTCSNRKDMKSKRWGNCLQFHQVLLQLLFLFLLPLHHCHC